MSRYSHTSIALRISELNLGIQNKNPGFKIETPIRCLRILETPKEWAGRLAVSHQKVNEWIRGEAIPAQRMFQIAEQAKLIYLNDLNPLQAEIDMMMLLQFGGAER